MKVHREKVYSYNLGLHLNTLVGSREMLDLFVSNLLIKLFQRGHRSNLGL